MKLLFSLFVIILLCGCSSRPSSLIPSTSPLPAGVRGTIPTRGTDCSFNLLGIIPLTTSPDTSEALEQAKRKADVDVLTDVTVDFNRGYYILFSNQCVRVNGMGVPRERLQAFLENPSRGNELQK